MIILGIDTSCDDTCIAVLEIRNSDLEIKSNIVSSQVKLHAKYGGVYPLLAKREHIKNLPVVLKKALRQGRSAELSRSPQGKSTDIDLIGVTVGPGLEPCLWQGVNFAKDLAKKWEKPLILINHIEAHIFANFVGKNSKFKIQNSKLFPSVCLVVSGGHTQLILMKDIGKYKLIGETRDDAAGECFDKIARILGLGYPGGPVIAAEAAKFGREQFSTKLPRPMIHQKNYDFSFSGLKTSVLYEVKKLKILNLRLKTEFCHETQQAIIDVLIKKTIKAAKNYKVKSIILGGGVAANDELRKQFKEKIKKELSNIQYLIPHIQFCTDNAVMVGITAYFHQKEATKKLNKIKAEANLRI